MPMGIYIRTEAAKKNIKKAAIKRFKSGNNKTVFVKGHVPTPEMRKKMGSRLEDHYKWRGGVTLDRKAYRRKWRNDNLEKSRAYMREWKKNHRQSANVYTQNYRALLRNAPGSFTPQDWENLKKKFDNKCAICGEEKPLTIDHIIPISRGGTNWIENIQPLCGSCNYSKRDMLMDEYLIFRQKIKLERK